MLLSRLIIMEKAKSIFADFQDELGDKLETFAASKGSLRSSKTLKFE